MTPSTRRVCTDIATLERVLEAAKRRAFGGRGARGRFERGESGAAGVMALKLVLQTQADLDAARAAVDGGDEMSEEVLCAKLAEEAHDMPDHHLEILVRAYVDRHGLDWPRRVVEGGAAEAAHSAVPSFLNRPH